MGNPQENSGGRNAPQDLVDIVIVKPASQLRQNSMGCDQGQYTEYEGSRGVVDKQAIQLLPSVVHHRGHFLLQYYCALMHCRLSV